MNLGQQGEMLVAKHYENLGFRILDRNFIFPKGKQTGELDLVALKDGELVFVEVKTRSSAKFGGPFESVDLGKQRKLVKMTKLYLQLHPELRDKNYRIDVAAVDIDNQHEPVIILPNAVEDTY
ncbi:MAG TPA: YraN family protein [Patescibacteria group bacterium]|nr:YraN family protein [Patescibacteria group bacterium]